MTSEDVVCRLRFLFILPAVLVLSSGIHGELEQRAHGSQQGRRAARAVPSKSSADAWLYKESHALVIGVSRYDHYPHLPGVADDVVAVAAALEKSGFKVEKLLNPSRDELDFSILTFLHKWGEGDQNIENCLLVYFAGHGCTVGKKPHQLGYIVPKNGAAYHGKPEEEPALRNTAISMDTFKQYIRLVRAKAVLFVFDSCFSGYMFEAINERGGKQPAEAPPIVWAKVGSPVQEFITAGTAEQAVPDNSIFRQEFIAGIHGEADYNNDGYVTGSELCEFLATEVANAPNSEETPLCGRSNVVNGGDFVFVVPRKQPGAEAQVGGTHPQDPWPLEAQYKPSGWMGDGEGEGQSPSKYLSSQPESQNISGKKVVALRIDYTRGPKGWAGIYWQHPERNWGDKQGYDLSDAKAITFYARGETGEEVVEFISGGIEGENKKYHDDFKKSLGQQVLMKEWQQYTIDLTDVPPDKRKQVIGAFAWVGLGGFDSSGKLITHIADIKVVR